MSSYRWDPRKPRRKKRRKTRAVRSGPLIDKVAAITGLDSDTVNLIVMAFIDEVTDCLHDDIAVQIRQLGQFQVHDNGRGRGVVFFTSREILDRLNREFRHDGRPDV